MSVERPEPRFEEAEADRRLAVNNADVAAMLAKADHRLLAGDLRAAAGW
jgi:thiamine monophosphate kinase